MCKKYCRTRQATDVNTGHALCMADNWGYKCTIRICNTYWFSKAIVVTRTHISVTFIRTLSCSVCLYNFRDGLHTSSFLGTWVMYNVYYSRLEIATTWWRQNGVVIRGDIRLSISVMRADGVRFLPARARPWRKRGDYDENSLFFRETQKIR
jgi:hypothetical protein